MSTETSACEEDKRKYKVNENMIYGHVRKTKKEQEIKRNSKKKIENNLSQLGLTTQN